MVNCYYSTDDIVVTVAKHELLVPYQIWLSRRLSRGAARLLHASASGETPAPFGATPVPGRDWPARALRDPREGPQGPGARG